jgi:hypothetical protein
MSSRTLESTNVTGLSPVKAAETRDSLTPQQGEQLVGAHRGSRPATHPACDVLSMSLATLAANNLEGITHLDDLYFVTFVQPVALPHSSRDRYLTLAVNPHRLSSFSFDT